MNLPIYDIEKSYLENLEQGPFFEGEIPPRLFPPREKWIDFLGYPIATPIGVPAGPLLDSKWVTFAAKMGFDVLTYKTIRSRSHPAHPLPNMLYVDTKGMLTQERYTEILVKAKKAPEKREDLALTNSFGIPSRAPEVLIEDIAKANRELAPGQVMIVSVVGTPRPEEDYFEDFVRAARLAKEGGAKIIEVDLSCPNVAACEGSLFTNVEAVYEICSRVKKEIGCIPLIIKVGVIPNPKLLKEIMYALLKGGGEGLCGINTISMKVIDEKGNPALGLNRLQSGVCGGPIHLAALDFVRMSATIKNQEKLDLTILATGGVILPHQFEDFLNLGANVAMSGIGMMWDPYLALRRQNG